MNLDPTPPETIEGEERSPNVLLADDNAADRKKFAGVGCGATGSCDRSSSGEEAIEIFKTADEKPTNSF